MANHSSAEKSIRQTVKRTAIRKDRTSRVKTYIKKVQAAIMTGNSESALIALRTAQSEIMRAVSKGVIKHNTGSRKVSRLCKSIKTMI